MVPLLCVCREVQGPLPFASLFLNSSQATLFQCPKIFLTPRPFNPLEILIPANRVFPVFFSFRRAVFRSKFRPFPSPASMSSGLRSFFEGWRLFFHFLSIPLFFFLLVSFPSFFL